MDITCTTCSSSFRGDRRRKYCDNCRPSCNDYMKKWYSKPGSHERVQGWIRRYRDGHRHLINERSRQRNWRLRVEAINAYGGTCSCCGEQEIRFLTLDHPNGDGANHRRSLGVGAGVQFYKALRREGYISKMVVMCWNCHMSKDKYGFCPHTRDCHI